MTRLYVVLGLGLIGLGIATLGWVYRQLELFFNSPDQVRLFTYLRDTLKEVDRTMNGTMDGKAFTIVLPESTISIASVVITIMGLGLIINLIRSFIGNGISLLKLANSQHKANPDDPPIRSRQIT